MIAVALAALVALWWWDPAVDGPAPPCPFLWLTGLLCAGCGVLRAIHALLHGDLVAAWFLNPLFVLALPLTLVAALASALGWRLSRPPVALMSVLMLVLFTVLRNL
jgi:hypothetical protein